MAADFKEDDEMEAIFAEWRRAQQAVKDYFCKGIIDENGKKVKE